MCALYKKQELVSLEQLPLIVVPSKGMLLCMGMWDCLCVGVLVQGGCILPEREGEFEVFISLLALAKNWLIFSGKDRCDTYRKS